MAAESLWTPALVEELKRLWEGGLTASQVGAELGFTRNAICGKVHRLKLPERPKAVKELNAKTRCNTASRKGAGRLHDVRKLSGTYAPPKEQRRVRNTVAGSKLRPERPVAAPVIFDASKAKLWLQRRLGECAYPISGENADTFSCCQPADDTGYCGAHRGVMFVKPQENAKRLQRLAVRFA